MNSDITLCKVKDIEKDFLNIEETAKYLSCKPATLRTMCSREQIPSYKPMKEVLFSLNWIKQFVLDSYRPTKEEKEQAKIEIERQVQMDMLERKRKNAV